MPTFSAPGADQFEMRSGEPGNQIWFATTWEATVFGSTPTSAYRESEENRHRIEYDGVFTEFDALGNPAGGIITAIRFYLLDEDYIPQLLYEITNAAYDCADFLTAAGSGPGPMFNFLTAGDDVINGSDGNDGLNGGAGDDTYYVDDFLDWTDEAAGVDSGYDTVISSANYELRANVEHLILTGASSIWGTGNALENIIEGNEAANRLSGAGGHDSLFGGAGDDILDGGAGPDDMYGGFGHDTFIVDNVDDGVFETLNQGVDKVQSRIDYTLGANVERLSLSHDGDINGTGNELRNVITGNGGDNVLTGLGGNDLLKGGAGDDTLVGGAGGDQLWGGAGADTFRFDTNAGIDRVMDFEDGDILAFDDSIFSSAAAVLAAIRVNADGDAVIVNGAFRVVLTGLVPGDLDADDIVIISSAAPALIDKGEEPAMDAMLPMARFGDGADWLI